MTTLIIIYLVPLVLFYLVARYHTKNQNPEWAVDEDDAVLVTVIMLMPFLNIIGLLCMVLEPILGKLGISWAKFYGFKDKNL
jgi:hypothetical protein